MALATPLQRMGAPGSLYSRDPAIRKTVDELLADSGCEALSACAAATLAP